MCSEALVAQMHGESAVRMIMLLRKEEVKLALNDLRLLNEARVNVGTLRRVVNEVLAVVAG